MRGAGASRIGDLVLPVVAARLSPIGARRPAVRRVVGVAVVGDLGGWLDPLN